MEENAVKELTKQGCMVGREAAEELTEKDVELIRELDTTPMYISIDMVQKLRQKMTQEVSTGGQKQVMKAKTGGGTEVEKQASPHTSQNASTDASGPVAQEQETDISEGQISEQEGEMEDSVVVSDEEDTVDEDSETDEIENEADEVEEKSADTDAVAEEESTEGLDEEVDEDKLNNDLDDDQEEIYQRRGSKFSANKTVELRDSGRRDELNTKVEILDEADINKEEKDVPEFLSYYNDRYDRMRKLLTRRTQLQSATTIKRLENRDEGEQATTVGLVKDKYSTSSGKYIVSIEDKTGTFKALVDEREGEMIVPDEMIGVQGNMGGDIIYANSVVRPDLPIPQGQTNTTEEEVKAAYISDLHMGSEDTLHDRLDRFAEWLGTEEASKIGYLVITGDLVEGVGIYPGQKDELEVEDIYKQYELFEEWFQKIPEDIQVIVGPGNHDITRLSEPQPKLPKDVFPNIADADNFHRVQNPQMVKLHGIQSKGLKHLMYHGYSFDDHVDRIQELRENAYDEPDRVMIDLLKRRHLAPTYGSNQLSPEATDHMVIEREPDVMVSGHFHSHAVSSYKGVNVICSSTFQAQTDFQKRVGHEPDPGKVTIMNFKNRKTEVKQF
ncbi:MAG: DNA-directed DNA polymerase II small subunit [Candidatus Nanohalobium sp.]